MKKLAIIKQVQFGIGDYGRMALWFTTYVDENGSALQVFHDPKEIEKILLDGRVSDVTKMNGKACWVNDDNGLIRFIEMAKGGLG